MKYEIWVDTHKVGEADSLLIAEAIADMAGGYVIDTDSKLEAV